MGKTLNEMPLNLEWLLVRQVVADGSLALSLKRSLRSLVVKFLEK